MTTVPRIRPVSTRIVWTHVIIQTILVVSMLIAGPSCTEHSVIALREPKEIHTHPASQLAAPQMMTVPTISTVRTSTVFVFLFVMLQHAPVRQNAVLPIMLPCVCVPLHLLETPSVNVIKVSHTNYHTLPSSYCYVREHCLHLVS